jgi:hypothetical protein
MARQSFQELTEFSRENKELEGSPSNLDVFLWRDSCISTIQLNRPIWNKICYSSILNPDRLEVLLSKTNSILTGKQGDRCS